MIFAPGTTGGEECHVRRLIDMLKQYWRTLRSGTPGNRFRHFYDVRRQQRHVSPVWTVALGIGLVVAGLLIGWLPGPGGFIAIIGLALLAQEFRLIATVLDWLELFLLRACQRSVRFWVHCPAFARVELVVVALIAAAGVGYVVYRMIFA
jgi:hypothetical protein